jgi:hypothetical protein
MVLLVVLLDVDMIKARYERDNTKIMVFIFCGGRGRVIFIAWVSLALTSL